MITQKELKKTLHYNHKTGIFKWIEYRTGVKSSGIAGFDDGRGYRRIQINGKTYKSHRLAWLYMTGEWPKDQIDHDNQIKGDNRWLNLKGATNQDNQRNQPKYKNNTSGITGVAMRKKKWVAKIKVDGTDLHLGCFNHKSEAIKARKEAERKFGFHKNHGLDLNNEQSR